ncbi:MAG TPA: DUF1501 domain-containing protein [Gemmataceae bacterium]|jgi:hypothetical protein
MISWSRREWLRLGGLGGVGLSLPALLRAEAAGPASRTGRSCVLFLLQGGPSQLDIWDMKPAAPAEVRGPFRPIATRVPGMQIVEHLPRLAQMTHRFSIVRSMTHKKVFHNSACTLALTGHPPFQDQSNLVPSEDDFPHLGALVALKRPGRSNVPTAVSLPNPIGEGVVTTLPGQNGGFLGARYAPFTIEGDPHKKAFAVDGLSVTAGAGSPRLAERQTLLETVNRQRPWLARDPGISQASAYEQRALGLLTSDAARRAFELKREPARLRERYGLHKYGQSLLLARRLIEAGVRLVTVYWGGRINNPLPYWDTHEDLPDRLRDELLPPFDQGFSAFLEDLDARGLLDSTLVVCTGEFGRTPRMGQFTGNGANPTGRDHWPHCYSLVVAGGGGEGGRVHGRSDRFAAYPAEEPYSPQDLTATILQKLGVNPHEQVRDSFGRLVPLSEGVFRSSLFGA